MSRVVLGFTMAAASRRHLIQRRHETITKAECDLLRGGSRVRVPPLPLKWLDTSLSTLGR